MQTKCAAKLCNHTFTPTTLRTSINGNDYCVACSNFIRPDKREWAQASLQACYDNPDCLS